MCGYIKNVGKAFDDQNMKQKMEIWRDPKLQQEPPQPNIRPSVSQTTNFFTPIRSDSHHFPLIHYTGSHIIRYFFGSSVLSDVTQRNARLLTAYPLRGSRNPFELESSRKSIVSTAERTNDLYLCKILPDRATKACEKRSTAIWIPFNYLMAKPWLNFRTNRNFYTQGVWRRYLRFLRKMGTLFELWQYCCN